MGIGHSHYGLGCVHEEASLVKDVFSGSVTRVRAVAETRGHLQMLVGNG